MFLLVFLAKIYSVISFQQYSLLLNPFVATSPNTSISCNQSEINHFTINPNGETNKRISFNEQTYFNLGSILRHQQAYYFELGRFANNYEELTQSGYGLSEDNNYELTIKSKTDLTFTFAIPKNNYATYKEWSGSSWVDAKEPLYSYVSGIAYSKDNGNFQSILCVSNIADRYKLGEPKIVEDKFVCPHATIEIP